MKTFRGLLLASLFVAVSCLVSHAAGVTDLQDLCTGPNEANCIWKVSASGGLLQGSPGGNSILNTAPNSAIGFTVIADTAIIAGDAMVVVSTTPANPLIVNGAMSTTSAATTVIGVADTSASSGTVVTVDFSGIAVALSTGNIAVGDLLVSTATAPGYLYTNNSASAGSIVATALESANISTPGLIRVLLHH